MSNQAVEARIALERKIVRKVLEAVLADPTSCVRLHNGDDWATSRTRHIDVVMDAIMQTDVDELVVYNRRDGWMSSGSVTFVYGNDGWDVVQDYSMSLDALLEPIMAEACNLGGGA